MAKANSNNTNQKSAVGDAQIQDTINPEVIQPVNIPDKTKEDGKGKRNPKPYKPPKGKGKDNQQTQSTMQNSKSNGTSGNAEGKMLNFKNYHNEMLSVIKYNSMISENDAIEVVDTSIIIRNSIRINVKRLKQQAHVFARQIINNTNVDYYRNLGIRDFDDQIKELENMYIYSYAKSYIYGSRTSSIGTVPDESFVFLGHAYLFLILRKGVFVSDGSNTINIRKEIRVNDIDHAYNIKILASNFRWLEIRDDVLKEGIYSVPKYDKRIRNLKKDDTWCCYDDLSKCDSAFQFLNQTSNPLGNSMYSDSFNNELLYIPNSLGNITDINYAINKALFIYNESLSMLDDDNTYYYSIKVRDLDKLTKYDVRAITSLRPKYNPFGDFSVVPIPSGPGDDGDEPDPEDQ